MCHTIHSLRGGQPAIDTPANNSDTNHPGDRLGHDDHTGEQPVSGGIRYHVAVAEPVDVPERRKSMLERQWVRRTRQQLGSWAETLGRGLSDDGPLDDLALGAAVGLCSPQQASSWLVNATEATDAAGLDVQAAQERLAEFLALHRRELGVRVPILLLERGEEEVRLEIEAVLAGGGLDLYRRNGCVVQLKHGVRGEATSHEPTLVELSQDDLVDVVRSHLAFFKIASGKLSRVQPPRSVVRGISRRGYGLLPTLKQVVGCPVLTDDGTLVDRPGFDSDTGIYYQQPPALEGLEVPDQPTRLDAERARALLVEAVADFPFADAHGADATVAAIVTQVARPAVNGAVPLFVVDGDSPGLGKTLLVQLAAHIANGRSAPTSPLTDGREMEKRLTAMLKSGVRSVLLDNASGVVRSRPLEAALTSQVWRGRVLGKSHIVEVQNDACFYLTGNGLELGPDLERRSVHIRLRASARARPAGTPFARPRLLEWVDQERATLVQAALTIVRGYLQAGQPPQGVPELGGFEEWSKLVRSAVIWAGGQDPCGIRPSTTCAGQDDGAIGEMLASLHQQGQRDGVSAARLALAASDAVDGLSVRDPQAALGLQVIRVCTADHPEVLAAIMEHLLGQRVGHRWPNGVRLHHAGEENGRPRWRLTRDEAR